MQIAAEVGLQHCGCLGTAFAFVDAIADAGAQVAKFQCHLGDNCDRFRPGTENYFVQDFTRRVYWNRTAFSSGDWRRLCDKCHNRGLLFSCSIFSLAGLEMMAPLCDQLKVPSSKTNDHELLRAVAKKGRPVVLSSGMSDRDEISRATDPFDEAGIVPTVLLCTSEYPTAPDRILLGDAHHILPALYPWGLSDHSGSVWPGIVAAWEGADMLEVHVCWSKQQWGPDVSSSLTVAELKQLVEGVRFVEQMRTSTVTKDDLARQLEPVRMVFRGA